MTRAQINVKDVPPSLVAAVNADAADRDASVNDVLGAILAARYGLAWQSSGYPYSTSTGDSNQWLIRMPEAMREVLREVKNAIPGASMSGIILQAVGDYYSLATRSPRKRTTSALDPETVRSARERHYRGGESIRSLAREFKVSRNTLTRAIRA